MRYTYRQAACSVLALAIMGSTAFSQDKYAATWSRAIKFLRRAQAVDGAWGVPRGKVGMTAVNLEGLALAPADARKQANDIMAKAAHYLVSQQKASGAIHDKDAKKNYSTSLAVIALIRYDSKRFAPQIAKAVKWIKGIQADERTRFDPRKHVGYGGFGYGSTTRPDLSNTWIALNALKLANVPADDPVWKKALIFVKRCQNSTEVNDIKGDYIGDDGGAKYLPTDASAGSPAGTQKIRDGRTIYKSYGSVSCGMLAAYIWSGLDKKDLPVRKVAGFLGKNFTLAGNIGAKQDGQQSRYYYYRALAKALSLYGQRKFAGHDWARELADMIVSLQRKDGSWSNPVDRWSEGIPALATGYAITALALAQRAMDGKTAQVTVIGKAVNAKPCAIVVAEKGVYYLDNMPSWPENVYGKIVRVSGNLATLIHKQVKGPEKRQQMTGEQLVLSDYHYRVVHK